MGHERCPPQGAGQQYRPCALGMGAVLLDCAQGRNEGVVATGDPDDVATNPGRNTAFLRIAKTASA